MLEYPNIREGGCNTMYPWTPTVLIALVVYGAICLHFNKIGKELAREVFFYEPKMALFTPLALFGCYWYYCANTGGMDWPTAVRVFCYFLVPSAFLWISWDKERDAESMTLWDAAAILFLWLPFDLHLITRRPNAIKDALDWPIIALSAVIIGLAFWVGLKKLEGTKAQFKWSLDDLACTLFTLVCLAVILIPLGKYTGFLVPREFWAEELQNGSISGVLWNHLVTWKFLSYLVKIYVTIALSEEFLFRGIIQNFLDNTLKSKWSSLAIASLLFGAAHLNNGATSLHPAGWNGNYAVMASIAGLAYGLVFRQTSSLLYPMLIHALVDAIWHTLFK